MINTLIGTKKGMTSTYDARGRRVGATVVEITPNYVTSIKTQESKDGYNAIQIGALAAKTINKPRKGLLSKSKIDANLRVLREARDQESDGMEPGKEILVNNVFSVGDSVKVTGVAKGKGFQGGVRRHGFHGGPKTHGQSDRHRAPGSIGSGTTPGRVFKGKNMAGHMGMEQVSVLGLEVIKIDRVNNLLTLKGAVPGPNEGVLLLEKQGRIKGYTPPPEEKEDEETEEAAPAGEEIKTEASVEAENTENPTEEKGEK